jgi:hypothetical protein
MENPTHTIMTAINALRSRVVKVKMAIKTLFKKSTTQGMTPTPQTLT